MTVAGSPAPAPKTVAGSPAPAMTGAPSPAPAASVRSAAASRSILARRPEVAATAAEVAARSANSTDPYWHRGPTVQPDPGSGRRCVRAAYRPQRPRHPAHCRLRVLTELMRHHFGTTTRAVLAHAVADRATNRVRRRRVRALHVGDEQRLRPRALQDLTGHRLNLSWVLHPSSKTTRSRGVFDGLPVCLSIWSSDKHLGYITHY